MKDEMKFMNATAPEGFDWSAKADPDVEADNYFQGVVSGELSEDFGRRVSVEMLSTLTDKAAHKTADILQLIALAISKITGEDKDFTRRDMLLIFAGFKAGIAYEMAYRTIKGMTRIMP